MAAMNTQQEVKIYTDGACSGNPGKGGLGIVLTYGSVEKELSFGYQYTTNNRMELLAVIIALEHLTKLNLLISVFSDSKYVVDAIEKKWLEKWLKTNFNNNKIKNKDLWLRYQALSLQHQIRFVWVKGHASNALNNRCDALAVKAYQQKNLLLDDGFVSS